jgi:hypothetical protein
MIIVRTALSPYDALMSDLPRTVHHKFETPFRRQERGYSPVSTRVGHAYRTRAGHSPLRAGPT